MNPSHQSSNYCDVSSHDPRHPDCGLESRIHWIQQARHTKSHLRGCGGEYAIVGTGETGTGTSSCFGTSSGTSSFCFFSLSFRIAGMTDVINSSLFLNLSCARFKFEATQPLDPVCPLRLAGFLVTGIVTRIVAGTSDSWQQFASSCLSIKLQTCAQAVH